MFYFALGMGSTKSHKLPGLKPVNVTVFHSLTLLVGIALKKKEHQILISNLQIRQHIISTGYNLSPHTGLLQLTITFQVLKFCIKFTV